MNLISPRETVTAAERDREYWRGVLLSGGVTTIPRWTQAPVAGVGGHDARISEDLLTGLRRRAHDLDVPLGSVLLTAHLKVLGALSGEREISTGYAAEDGNEPLPLRVTIGSRSWRRLLLATHQAESEMLSHRDFPVDDLRHELGLTRPLFEAVFCPRATDGGALDEGTVLWVGLSEHDGLVLRLRYRTDVLDADCAARIAGYHLSALALIAADP